MKQQHIMNWNQLLCRQRLGCEDSEGSSPSSLGRSDFHKDHDRIAFSNTFRRLGRKTQVHPLSENDHVHTRLTHSIEVSCVGRSLGVLVGHLIKDQLPDTISPYDLGAVLQAACLAHDMGHPPFGHAGEYAIRDWFQRPEHAYLFEGLSLQERCDLQTFEGNAQGFRIITQLENHRFDGGMRLTYATLGTLLKYPWTALHALPAGKFNCFQSEKALLTQIATALGLPQTEEDKWAKHPLTYLMEAADDICYAILDIEDGIEIGMLSYEMVEPLLLGLCGESTQLQFELNAAPSIRRKIAHLRGKVIDRCVEEVAQAFVSQYQQLMRGDAIQELLNTCSTPVSQGMLDAKQLAAEHIFNARRKVEMEIGAFSCLDTLLDTFCHAAYQLKTGARIPFRMQRILDLMEYNAPKKDWPLYEIYRRVLDFVGGMTDNYASYLAHQIGGIGK